MANKREFNWGLFLAGLFLCLANAGLLLGVFPATVAIGSQQIAVQTSIIASSAVIGALIAFQRFFD